MNPDIHIIPQNQVYTRGKGSAQATEGSAAMGLAAARVAGTAAADTTGPFQRSVAATTARAAARAAAPAPAATAPT